MFGSLARAAGHWQAYRRFASLDSSFRKIVFYSEGPGDWPHLGPVVDRLLNHYNRKISYLTSDLQDPGLKISHPAFHAFEIGSDTVRTILFRGIECEHLVLTLTDLQSMHIKRSVHPVHYVYLFHAINSTHTVYRRGAFDAYDTILCVGPHHVDEIRKTENRYGYKRKELIEHGSIKLDSVIEQYERSAVGPNDGDTREVLIAPSWGECSLIENPAGAKLIDILLDAGYRTTLRLHPMTVRRKRSLISALESRYSAKSLFAIEDDMSAVDSWIRADAMISDWSGAAIEYAFATTKPVIYINTQQKINNPSWQEIGADSFEDMIRSEIGQVVEWKELQNIPQLIERALRAPDDRRAQIIAARNKWIFNVGRSREVASEYLASLA